MLVQTNVSYIPVEIRCMICDQCIQIIEQYEANGKMVIGIEPCEECEDEN